MRVAVTGAGGFLGWHTCVRLGATTDHQVVPIDRDGWQGLAATLSGADAVIHIAGVNRGPEDAVESDNVRLAEDLADALARSERCTHVVYANSTQSGNGTPYGSGKEHAGELLRRAAAKTTKTFVDVRLPNLFGEHGRPMYNSFVATFVDAVNRGRTPEISDRAVRLLHVQAAAQTLIDAIGAADDRVEPGGTETTVQGVYDRLTEFDRVYSTGELPDLTAPFDVDLFNTFRASRFPDRSPIQLTPRADQRGRLVEVVRSRGGEGQTFVSTTKPGVTRGEHFHLRKIERFVVLAGSARISLRRLLSDQVVSFDVSGEVPCAIDMPTMWAHNITNTGESELTTLFWTNELFDPEAPDTHPEKVGPASP
ncbi:NAD-dependent epimerase/dehydratase family protein [Occultella kanbiaonis]|uniref:polysaccharide biosynthesis C-terminal domain-containing protein n=1 Tax=Occultella kanbiaonis TaxID=2675754 RepID=UPI0013D58A58|nr:NAD-dependent epimerase/dehydratase family protein [Occultella kanbiaonis]